MPKPLPHNEQPVEIRGPGTVVALTGKELMEEMARSIISSHILERDGISIADALKGTKDYQLDTLFLPHELDQIGIAKDVKKGCLCGQDVIFHGRVQQITRIIKAIPAVEKYAEILSGLRL